MRTSRQKTGTGMRTGHRDYVEMDSLKTLHENLGMAGVTITKTVSVEVEVVR